MKIKFHCPTQQYGFLEIEGESENIKEAEALYNQYAETPLSFKSPGSLTIKLSSFNEPGVEVDFNPITHEYFYKGVKLSGASSIVKKFVPAFDVEQIAKACEKSWGIPARDIANLWDSNRDVSTEFGTLVHKTLEHYFKSISKGFTDEKAMPKHPILKEIIEGFLKVAEKDAKIESEILVTDIKNGRCGQVDRLAVLGDKRCRVEDYKVNVGSEEVSSKNKLSAPYDKLPANKLSKYSLQLSVYAQMLENSGWTVEGLRAYVYEDEWKSYELTKTKI